MSSSVISSSTCSEHDVGVGGEIARVLPQVVELALQRRLSSRWPPQEQRVLVVEGAGGTRPVAAAGDQRRGRRPSARSSRGTIDHHELVVHDLVDPADVDADLPRACPSSSRAAPWPVSLRSALAVLKMHPHVHAARDRVGERRLDRPLLEYEYIAMSMAVLGARDQLGDARVVARVARLGREDDVGR